VVTLEVYAGQAFSALTSGELVQAVAGAAAPWSEPQLTCTSVELTVEGVPQDTAPVKRDGVNRVVFRRDSWCPDPREPGEPCYSPQALAQTTDVVDLETGQIIESDIEVNAVDYVWSDLVLHPVPGAHDLQNALTHEIGHLLGFAHSCHLTADDPSTNDDQGRPVPACTGASREAVASTMFPAVNETDLERRSLTEDDQRGVCDVYPKGITSGQTEVAAPLGGCAVGGGNPPSPLLLVLVLVLATATAARILVPPSRRAASARPPGARAAGAGRAR
jgi:hypothetical protein